MKKIIVLAYILSSYTLYSTTPIVINPAGDAHHLGRKLNNGYERAATLRFAEELQQKLARSNEEFDVVVSRRAGETVVQQETASFVNRLQATLAVTIQVYRCKTAKPKIYLYHLCYNPFTELTAQTSQALAFTPLHKTHRINMATTIQYAKNIATILSKRNYQKQFDCIGPQPAPIKALIGMVPPALTIEIGINKEQRLETLVVPIAKAIQQTISS